MYTLSLSLSINHQFLNRSSKTYIPGVGGKEEEEVEVAEGPAAAVVVAAEHFPFIASDSFENICNI
jgi:hypothetical protein